MTSSSPPARRPSPKLDSSDLKNPINRTFSVRGEPRLGEICPSCGKSRLDYDGLLNLGCPKCGYTLVGSFT